MKNKHQKQGHEENNDTHEKNEESDVKSEDVNVEKLKEENVTLKDALLRSMAETENLRKRFEKDKDDIAKFANAKFAKDLLIILDNFDLAIKNAEFMKNGKEAEVPVKVFYDGVVLTDKEMKSVLARHGIREIDIKVSDDLDPNYHQVMNEVKIDSVPEGKIAEIYQKGYMVHDRLLRPVLVAIAKKIEQ